MTETLTHLIDRLPDVRGQLIPDAPLAPLTWFRVGGPAEVLFRPADAEDLAAFLSACPEDVPVTIVGVGSNLLVRDGGVKGVVIRLGKAFAQVTPLDNHRVRAGTAALDMAVARTAMEAGIAGLEFFRGIPGSIGGALRMNGGAYEKETCDVLIEAHGVTRAGAPVRFSNADMGYSYRHSELPKDVLLTSAVFQGEPGNPAEIEARMNEITERRETSQPIRTRTGGSTFKNPEGHKSWQLIDAAGCRGLKRGGAQVSEKHCNFLINTGDATAADIEDLGEDVRARVKETSGVTLDWEIRRIGERLQETGE